jgi:hypothetical protein
MGVQADRGNPGPLARCQRTLTLLALVRAGARFERGVLVEHEAAA